MMRPWLLFPILAMFALAGALIWFDSEKDHWTPPPAKAPDLPVVPTMQPPPLSLAQDAHQRPMLWSSRAIKKVKSSSDPQIEDLGKAKLVSIIQTPSQVVALIRRVNGTMLKLTQDTSPWKIESHDPKLVTLLATDGQTISLRLESAFVPKTVGGVGSGPQ